ncbi:MAG: hypothetical protein DYG89_40215 [Caldilinea sp. CFX5]|nr:hypothetical protein [Caldilinea sp. CFX5]
MQNQPIVGVWQVKIKVEGMNEGFDGLYTFFADGNFLDINSLKETNPGVWSGSGNTYLVTFWGFVANEQGQYNAKGRVRGSIHLDDSNHLIAHGVTDVFDREGKPIDHQFNGPFTLTGTRVTVEPL